MATQTINPGEWVHRKSTHHGVVGVAPVLIKSGTAELIYLQVENPGATRAYINIFDAASVDDVTIGETEPTLSLMVPAGGAYDTPELVLQHENGIVLAATSSFDGSEEPGDDLLVNSVYR